MQPQALNVLYVRTLVLSLHRRGDSGGIIGSFKSITPLEQKILLIFIVILRLVHGENMLSMYSTVYYVPILIRPLHMYV